MHYFSCTQEFYRVTDVGVIGETKNIVVSRSCLLFCYYHVFAMFLVFQKTQKILIFQGLLALLKSPIFQKFQCISIGTFRVPGIRFPTMILSIKISTISRVRCSILTYFSINSRRLSPTAILTSISAICF